MCWAEKCCYFIPTNLGCVLLGVCSFMLSTFIMVASVVCYVIQVKEEAEDLRANKDHIAVFLGLMFNIPSVHIILIILIIVAGLWMIFSIMLIIGIAKNKSSFVLGYFSFGIIITILCQLNALLVLLQNSWIIAFVLFIASFIHIHCLVVVHTVYELMQRGKIFSFDQHDDHDANLLTECFDEQIDNI